MKRCSVRPSRPINTLIICTVTQSYREPCFIPEAGVGFKYKFSRAAVCRDRRMVYRPLQPTYRRPLSAKETTSLSPTIIWSNTLTSINASADLRCRVIRSSCSLIFTDLVVWNMVAWIKKDYSVTVIINIVVFDPAKACFDAEDTFRSTLENSIV